MKRIIIFLLTACLLTGSALAEQTVYTADGADEEDALKEVVGYLTQKKEQ